MSELKALIRLQEYDTRLARLEAEASRLPKRIEAIQASRKDPELEKLLA